MNFKNVLHIKRKEESIPRNDLTPQSNDSVQLAPTDEAKDIAKIVDEGIANENYEAMNERLEKIGIDTDREDHVFIEHHLFRNVIITILAILLILFCLATINEATAVVRYSNTFKGIATTYIVCFIIFGFIDILLIRGCAREIRFDRRYQKYFYLLKYKSIVLTEELADYAKVPLKKVVSDIKLAIKRNYIPQGYFGKNNEVVFLSNRQYLDYKENYVAYNRYYEKLIDEYRRVGERPEEIQQLLDTGEDYIKKIHNDNDIIKDKTISDKLDEMERIVTVIFREVDIDPTNADKLGLLLNYYLPTTEKLLQTYIDLDERKIQGQNFAKAKSEIVSSLDTTNKAYQRILDSFFASREMDVSSDIAAMTTMMQQEGLSDG